jgi:DNA-binding transcriptional LysR family regulator
MELRHLRYFATVAAELHFGRAAARLNIAAPTLSHQIGALETMLGAKLFTRRTKSAVALTNAGKRFLIEAQETLRQAAHAELVGRQAGRGDAGSMSIGYVLSASCGGLVSSKISRFRAKHPDTSFEIAQMQTVAQFKGLIDGSLDIGFTREPIQFPTELTGFTVDRQPFCVAMPEGHRLAKHEEVTPDMLADESFVVASLEMEVGFGSNLAAISPPGVSLRIVKRAPDVFTMLTLVAAGFGICVLSNSLACIAIPGLTFREIADVKRMSDHIAAYRKNESAPVVLAFIKFLRGKAGAR